MSDIDHIKSLINQAETYHSQGLLNEAKGKYSELLEFLQNHRSFASNSDLIDSITNKTILIENELAEIDLDDDIPDLSVEVQDLIIKLFAFSDDRNISDIEGTVALAKFGQFDRALKELERITDEGIRIGSKQNFKDIDRHFNEITSYLKDSYRDIKRQSLQIMRYAKDLAQSYQRLREEEKLRTKLSRYVGQNLLDRLVISKDDILFGNERREMTILFADIRFFTKMSESLPAEEIVSMLNVFFSAMVDVIFKNNGVLDKFIGDEIMAIFGPPFSENSSSCLNAVNAAIGMQQATEKIMVSRRLAGKEIFEIGIGINTGEVILGNVGSRNRMDYTVIGDAVNTASRLQSTAKGGEIIIGAKTYEETKDQFTIRKRGKIKLKNKKKPVICYQVCHD
ncbi:MAG: adenylate/guanylate cyclase domain-containing protein [Deltaproteobacteria bacterium]|nr:adenylate/guanylate cyclase domain-containing protein [Deltaproteobacteria bacterium]